MATYTLTATKATNHSLKKDKVTFKAENDNTAIFEATFKVLDKAYNNELWAKGRIELKDQLGNLLVEMEAK